MARQYPSAGTAQIDGAINDSTTTVVIKNGSNWPTAGTFDALVDDEVIYFASTGDGGTTWTVTRGSENTVAATHSDSADLTVVVTEGLLDGLRNETRLVGVAASLPSSPRAGDLYIETDTPFMRYYDGSSWITWLKGSEGIALDEYDASGDTWVNQMTSTNQATQSQAVGGTVLYIPPRSSLNCSLLAKTAPSTPWSWTVVWDIMTPTNSSVMSQGLALRESATGEYIFVSINPQVYGGIPASGAYSLTVAWWNSPTSFNSSKFTKDIWGVTLQGRLWMRLTDDGTDIGIEVSPNGYYWYEVYSEGRTGLMAGGPDQLCLCANSQASVGPVVGHYLGEILA